MTTEATTDSGTGARRVRDGRVPRSRDVLEVSLCGDGMGLLAAAYARAVRCGHGRVGTEHVLGALLEEPVAGAILRPARCALEDVIRTRGDHWRSTDTADRAGAADIAAGVAAGLEVILSEAQRRGRMALPPGLRTTPMIFSAALVGAVCRVARFTKRDAGERTRCGEQTRCTRATSVDLAMALLDDPGARAHEALVLSGVDPAGVRGRLAALRPFTDEPEARMPCSVGSTPRTTGSYRLVAHDEVRRVQTYEFGQNDERGAS